MEITGKDVADFNPNRTKSRWISVNEELPGKRETYLITMTNPVSGKSIVSTSYFEPSGRYWRKSIWPITHWQPLPEPAQ